MFAVKFTKSSHLNFADRSLMCFPIGITSLDFSPSCMACAQVPKKLIVVGAGYIALEFACIFNNLGSQVDVFIRGDGVLRGFDKEVRALLLFPSPSPLSSNLVF